MCEEEVSVALSLWQFSQILGNKPYREHWVHPINQKMDISKLKLLSTSKLFMYIYRYSQIWSSTFNGQTVQ